LALGRLVIRADVDSRNVDDGRQHRALDVAREAVLGLGEAYPLERERALRGRRERERMGIGAQVASARELPCQRAEHLVVAHECGQHGGRVGAGRPLGDAHRVRPRVADPDSLLV
jgi:hypothetical protein